MSMKVWMTAALAASAIPAVAQEAAGPIRGVIESQLRSFLADDAEGAWSFASPGIQRMFGTREVFMAMVRQGYAPVYRPRDWTFGEMRDTPSGPEQDVRIVDEAGDGWIAVYSMERQPDGSWRISGCRLVKAPPPTA